MGRSRIEPSEGQEQRVAEVFRRRRAVLSFLVRRVGSFAVAQELFSELLLQAAEHPEPAGTVEFRRWLYGRARGLCGAYNRAQRRQQEVLGWVLPWTGPTASQTGEPVSYDELVPGQEPTPARVWEGQELAQCVLDALRRLPELDQAVLLRLAQGQPLLAVAADLGWPRARLQRRVVGARQQLLASLGPDLATEVRLLLQGRAELPTTA